MAVKVVKHPDDVAVGKFVNAGRNGVHGQVTGPRLITEIKGTRLYYLPDDSTKQTYFVSSSAVYVRDTREESQMIYDLTYKRTQEEYDAVAVATA